MRYREAICHTLAILLVATSPAPAGEPEDPPPTEGAPPEERGSTPAGDGRAAPQDADRAARQQAGPGEVAPQSTYTERITVTAEAEKELGRVPGGTAVVPRQEIEHSLAHNLDDVLAFTPGVVGHSRSGADESQLSIRGSGIRNNFHHRGLNLLVNGVPLQAADGFSDYERIELLATERIEIWKGANALRYGGNATGGAINFVTPDGRGEPPLSAVSEGGSFGLVKGQIAGAGAGERAAWYLSASTTDLDGFREHGEQERRRLYGNLSWRTRPDTEWRADWIYADVSEKLPGSLTRDEVENDPRQADSTNVRQDWGRFYDYGRLALGWSRSISPRHRLEVTAHAQATDLEHPIFQVLDQDSRDAGAEVRYTFSGEPGSPLQRLVAGVSPSLGSADERRYVNDDGQRGALLDLFGTEARNAGLYFESEIRLSPSLSLIAGGRADWSSREFDDRFPSNGDRSDRRTFRALQPRLGLMWTPRADLSVFGNVSRSWEPPLLLELTSFTEQAGFVDLQAQDTWQFEVGTRGRVRDAWSWDAALYDMEIDNEILNENVTPFPGALFRIPSFHNARRTRHLGLELGTSLELLPARARSGAPSLTWRLAYTLSRFRFAGDERYGDNRLPGAPRHRVRSEIRWRHPRGLWIAPQVDWSPSTYFVDGANTSRNLPYALLGLKAGFDWERFGVYVEGANLTDRTYSGSVVVDDDSKRYYEPGNGRSVYAGLRFRLSPG